MTANLIAELVKMGIPARLVAKEIAKTIDVNEKTARNKINGVTAFTIPEAIKINENWFNGAQKLEYPRYGGARHSSYRMLGVFDRR